MFLEKISQNRGKFPVYQERVVFKSFLSEKQDVN